MSLLINALIRLYGMSASHCFDKAAKNLQETQSELLFKILKRNAESVFGKTYGFSAIHTQTDFRAQIPIREFEEFRPYVQSILSGEKAVLTIEDIIRFNVTSGTTGEPKYIPVTREYQNQELNLIGQWYYRALRDHPQFLDHYRVAIVSPLNDGRTDAGIPYGSASGMVLNRIPPFIRRFYALPDSAFQVKDYDDRYFIMARCAAGKKVSFVLTPNPSTLIRLAEVMIRHADEIIRAIHDGKTGRNLSDQPDLSIALGQGFSPDHSRARFLENVFKTTGMLRPEAVWPELKLIACWLGGSVGLQRPKLSEFYGDSPIRDFGYMASEAHITLPYQDYTPSGVLAIQTNYYEFIPEEFHGTQNPPVLSCHELQAGKRYAILLTTSSGFYRYDINDIIEVTGFYQQVPMIAFVRKGRDMTNITGEKMHANHFVLAMEQTRRKFHLSLEQFRATPDFEKSRYIICMELGNELTRQVLKDEVLPFIDQALSKANLEYAEKRKSKRLRPPVLALMRHGWTEIECRKFVQAGKRDIQFKWRILCAELSREDIESVTEFIESGEN